MSSTITALTSGGGIALAGDTSGQLELKTNNGTTAVTIDASQNVGIGTASPSNKLEVNGSVRASTGDFGGSSGDLYLATLNRAGQTSSPTIDCQSATKPLVITHDSALPIIFGTSNTERMRIDSSGNVGIGTASPIYKLDVVNSGGTSYVQVKGVNAGTTITTPGNGGATVFLRNTDSTANNFSAIYNSDGGDNVNNGIAFINVNDANNEGATAFMTRPSGGSLTERMRITSAGEVTIGNTSSSDFQFNVAGGASKRGLRVRSGGNGGISILDVADTNGNSGMQLQANGNFILAASYAEKASGTTWANPSDSRIKKNVIDYTKGLAELSQVNVKSWEYNGKANTTDGLKGLGVIADEIMQVLPDTVTTYEAKLNAEDETTTDIKRFDATEITWLLVNAVKEQQALIENLTTRLAVLEGAK